MRNKSLTGKFLMAIMLVATSIFAVTTGSNKVHNVKAVSFNDTTSYVSVGEIFNTTDVHPNDDNFNILLKYITGNASATMEDVNNLAAAVTDASEIRATTLAAGDNYTAKTAEQDIIVRIGGLDWQVMYLSKDNNNNTILTLWLDNNVQDAWENRKIDEGAYYGYYQGGLYSMWTADYDSETMLTYPSNMYGTSYINAVTLNNGGKYTNNGSSLITASQSDNSAFAMFTMEKYGLTKFLVTPRNVGWQENQSYKTIHNLISSYHYNYPNDAWSKTTSDDGFYSANMNFAERNYSDAWANSYVWLPSISETGHNSTYNGLWKTSTSQRANYDGTLGNDESIYPDLSGIGSDQSSTYNTSHPTTLLRSGYDSSPLFGVVIDTNGGGYECPRISFGAAVRPAIHLNLTAISFFNMTSIEDGNMELTVLKNTYEPNLYLNSAVSVKVTVNGTTLNKLNYSSGGDGYTLTYTLNGQSVDPESQYAPAGTYVVTAKGCGNYYGEISKSFTINQAELKSTINVAVGVFDPEYTYTGTEIKPEPSSIYATIGEGEILTKGTDYTLTYSSDCVNVGQKTITINFIGNYTGTVFRAYKIVQRNVSDINVSGVSNQPYTGHDIKPSLTLTYNGATLKKDTDYTVKYKNAGSDSYDFNVGTKIIEITGIGNYTGTKSLEYQIYAVDISSSLYFIFVDGVESSYPYTGTAITPEPVVTYETQISPTEETLVKGTDYDISYADNTNVGKATITITGKGNYTGTKTITYDVTQKNIVDVDVSVTGVSGFHLYTGNEIKPDPVLTYNGNTLRLGTDYTVTYPNDCVNAGEKTITILGSGNYNGTRTETYNVEGVYMVDSAISVAGVETTYVYTGTDIKPEPVLTHNGKTLVKGTDYTLTYSDDNYLSLGEKTITIEGVLPNYRSTRTITYQIVQKNISDSNVVVSGVEDKLYTGTAVTQNLNISYNGMTLEVGKDYTITYSDNVNVGTATITILGSGNYTGTKTVTFGIGKQTPTVTVVCADSVAYEQNPVNLKIEQSSVAGTLTTETTHYVAGQTGYVWTFVPTDTTKYTTVTGTISITVVPLAVTELNFSGNFKQNYVAYDVFDVTNLVVNAKYNSGKIVELQTAEYSLSKSNGSTLQVGDVVSVTYLANESISANLPITITARVVTIKNKEQNVVENGEQQYVVIEFENEISSFPVNYEVSYFNSTTNSSATSLLEKGKYTVTVTSLDNNYVIEDGSFEVEVLSKTINSNDNNVVLESESGFSVNESLSYQVETSEEQALQNMGAQSFGVEDKFVVAYKLNLENDKSVTMIFKPEVSDISKINVYKLVGSELELVSHSALDNGYISISCSSADEIFLFEKIDKVEDDATGGEQDNTNNKGQEGDDNKDNNTLDLILIIISSVLGVAVVVVTVILIIKKFKK